MSLGHFIEAIHILFKKIEPFVIHPSFNISVSLINDFTKKIK